MGDVNGNPIASWGWRVSCGNAWNTTDGGPCVLRPTSAYHDDSPNPGVGIFNCYNGLDLEGKPKVTEFYPDGVPNLRCKGVSFNDSGIQLGGGVFRKRYGLGWSNMFALPYEINLYREFEQDKISKRPIGCGTEDQVKDFPFEIDAKTHYMPDGQPTGWGMFHQSSAMNCAKNQYAPEGTPIHEIVDVYAKDHDIWAKDFLDAWQRMQANGYENLKDGPQNSWLGHYSLTNMGVEIGK